MVTDHSAARAAARPVVAGAVLAGGKRSAERIRARQDVVHVLGLGIVTIAARNLVAVLVECGLVIEIVPVALVVAVQIGYVGGDPNPVGVVPRTGSDAVAGIHCAGALRAQVGAPGAVTRSGGSRQTLAVGVGSRQPAQVTTVADGPAGDEEGHGLLLFLGHRQGRDQNGQRDHSEKGFPHIGSPSPRNFDVDHQGRLISSAVRIPQNKPAQTRLPQLTNLLSRLRAAPIRPAADRGWACAPAAGFRRS